jgi:hypothetical protein
MRPFLLIPAAGLLALTGLAVAQGVADRRLDEAIARLREALPPGATLTYATASAEPAADRVRLARVTLAIGKDALVAEEVVLDGLRAGGGGAARLVARDIALREAGQQSGRVERITLAGLRLPAAGQAFDLAQLRLDLAEIERAAVRAPSGEAVGFSRLRVQGIGAGQRGALALDELRVVMPGTPHVDEVALDRLALNGVPVIETAQALLGGQMPASFSGRSDGSLEGLRLSHGGREVGRVARITSESDDLPGRPGVTTSRFAIAGASFAIPPALSGALSGFGYQRIAFGFELDGDFDETRGEVELRRMRLAVEEAGTLDFAARLSGLAGDLSDTSAMRLHGFTFTYADASLIQRAFRADAQRTRRSEAQVRRQAIAQLHGALGVKLGVQHPVATPIATLLERGGTLTLEARPRQPVGEREWELMQGDPAVMSERLGLTATHR